MEHRLERWVYNLHNLPATPFKNRHNNNTQPVIVVVADEANAHFRRCFTQYNYIGTVAAADDNEVVVVMATVVALTFISSRNVDNSCTTNKK